MIERTFAIIKPEAIEENSEKFIVLFTVLNGFKIINHKQLKMTNEQAREFYKEHEGQEFYERYVNHMTDKPIIVLILEREDGISAWRELIGSTDHTKARIGTIRHMFGRVENNVILSYVHGSSSKEAYEREAKMFFEEI